MSDKALRAAVEAEIQVLFREWDPCDIQAITERILDDVIDDVIQTSDYQNHSIGDIRIAIKRIILFDLG